MKKIAVLGPKGTYSDIACQKLFQNKNVNIIYYPSILKAFLGLDECDYALLPFENTLDGYVMEALDLVIQNNYYIVEQISIDIDFAFVSNCKDISQIKEIFVMPKAYGQCTNFIINNYLTPIYTSSNIESLDMVLKSSESYGAIVPYHSVTNTTFKTKIFHIADSMNNKTRFVLVKKGIEKNRFNDLVISLSIEAKEDKPGILYDILSVFEKNKLNLTSIMSRPNKIEIGKYIFYFELALDSDKLYLINELKIELEKKYDINILGIYNRL